MIQFTRAITKQPAQSLINGLSLDENNLKPDYQLALKQHEQYINALKQSGLSVMTLPASEAFPDSCFVEDIAVLAPEFAIITRPGAETRRQEITTTPDLLSDDYTESVIHTLTEPALLEGGDVMLIDKQFYIGLSSRTNAAGVEQFTAIAQSYGYAVTAIPVSYSLHLKTGVTYLGDNRLVMTEDYQDEAAFAGFEKIITPSDENNCANIIRINSQVIVPEGYSETQTAIEALGYQTIAVNISEFAKIDGGLTCLSLRF